MNLLYETTLIALDREDVDLLAAIWDLSLLSSIDGEEVRSEITKSIPKLTSHFNVKEVTDSFPEFVDYFEAEKIYRELNDITEALKRATRAYNKRGVQYLIKNYRYDWGDIGWYELLAVAAETDSVEVVKFFYSYANKALDEAHMNLQPREGWGKSRRELEEREYQGELDEFNASVEGVIVKASENENIEIIEFIAEQGRYEEVFNSAFYIALKNSSFDLLEWLLNTGVEIEGIKGSAAIALSEGKQELAEYLLRWDSDLDSFLGVAASLYYTDILESYLDQIPLQYEEVLFDNILWYKDYSMIDLMSEEMLERLLKYIRAFPELDSENEILNYVRDTLLL